MDAIIVRRSPNQALTVVEPFYRPMSLLDEIERFVSDVSESCAPVDYSTIIYPRLDIYREKGELIMRAELPGIRKEDIGITLEDGCLTIKAEKKPEKVSKDVTYYSCERCFGDYSRSVSLPFSVDVKKVSATFENGLLEIRVPKAEEVESKRIEIKAK